MKTISKFKLIAFLGLSFLIFTSEEGCQDPREDKDLYGPEDDINQGWEDAFGNINSCDLQVLGEETDDMYSSDLYRLIFERNDNWLELAIQYEPVTDFGSPELDYIYAFKQADQLKYAFVYKNDSFDDEFDENRFYQVIYNCSGDKVCESYFPEVYAADEFLIDLQTPCFQDLNLDYIFIDSVEF